MDSRPLTHIVVLGASFAGVSTAHRLLKESGKKGAAPLKVTLVSPNTHFYWNIAAPRAIIPGQIADEKLFLPLEAGFKQYLASKFEIIVASAKSLDFEAKTVHLDFLGSDDEKVLTYDFLVLATGSSTLDNPLFKTLTSTEATKEGLHALQAEIEKAGKIVIAGAGATGVEIAGELAFEYGTKKEIILVTSGPTILEATIPSVRKAAAQFLRNLNVDLRLNTKVVNTVKTSDNQQILEFSDGEKLLIDLYIPTIGVKPNSSYIPEKHLNNNAFVIVDDFLKVKGVDNVWAIGDVSDREPPVFMAASNQATYAAKSLGLILSKKTPLAYKDGIRGMGITVGKKAGTGHLGSVKLPGFLVLMLRKNMFLEKAAGTVDGSEYK